MKTRIRLSCLVISFSLLMNIKAKIVAIIVNILSKINLLSIAIGFINAGIAITNYILNILDPIILPRAISPSFLHEAIIDVISSGRDVPIATIVNPISLLLISK